MRLLIGGAKSKFFHLKELGDALTEFEIEYKLVNDVEIYSGFPDTKYTRWLDSRSKFKKLVKEFEPDAVLVDRQAHFGLAALKEKIPLFVHLRGDFWSEIKWARETMYKSPHLRFALWWRTRLTEKNFKGATEILPICNYLANIIKTRYPNNSVSVLYQGINHSLWYPVNKMNLKHPCVGILQDANIWGKTREMLTLTKVLEAMPEVTFYWVGDGPYRDYVLPTLKKYPNFHWLGYLQYPEKVREFLDEIDLYALISGIDMAPLTLLEAELMENSVIATNVGGIPELMKNEVTGFLVEKGDHKKWIEKISLLLNDSQKSKAMGTAARKFVVENFSWSKIAKDFSTELKMSLEN